MLYTLRATDAATGRIIESQVEATDPAGAAETAHARGWTAVQILPAAEAGGPALLLDYEAAGTIEPFPLKSRAFVIRVLLGVEAVLLLAGVSWVFAESGTGDRNVEVASLMVAGAFLILQLGILAPVTRPRPAGGPGKSPWYWLSAIALGLVLGALVVSAILLAADFYWATHETFSNDDRDHAALLALFMALASWILSVPLIMVFMKRRRSESFLARVAAILFLGSVVEVIAGIPILELARRRDSCTCGLASFWAILLATLTGTILLGPMIFLIILSRRTRAVSRGFCAACGLDLRPVTQRDPCPRCGAGWKSTF